MRKIKNDFEIILVEQFNDGKDFNRGKLLNIGALFAKGYQFIFHDVDMIPAFDYYPALVYSQVMQLAWSDIQTTDYLGGVTSFSQYAFFSLGGYSNNFFSRAEDNEMMFNIKRTKYTVVDNRFMHFVRLNHERTGVEFDHELWKKAQLPRAKDDGIEHCNFVLKSTTALPAGINSRKYIVSI